jgi:hypothetical protein
MPFMHGLAGARDGQDINDDAVSGQGRDRAARAERFVVRMGRDHQSVITGVQVEHDRPSLSVTGQQRGYVVRSRGEAAHRLMGLRA